MIHTSVLLKESIDLLNLSSGDTYLDATLGSAGHALEVYRRFGESVRIIGIDADGKRIERAGKILKDSGCEASLKAENFRYIDAVLASLGIKEVDAILFDLGLNSEQLEGSGKGFSFQKDEPLLMTFADAKPGMLTAREIVNGYDEKELEGILRDFGEERQARNIARAITETRKENPIRTTFELVEAIRRGYRGKYPRTLHFATRTFQALRIAVNDELGALREGIQKGFGVLSSGGRMAVISFHSLEDRTVKLFFREKAQASEGILITKKPITATEEEKGVNPRARSAKLRVIEKSKQKN